MPTAHDIARAAAAFLDPGPALRRDISRAAANRDPADRVILAGHTAARSGLRFSGGLGPFQSLVSLVYGEMIRSCREPKLTSTAVSSSTRMTRPRP